MIRYLATYILTILSLHCLAQDTLINLGFNKKVNIAYQAKIGKLLKDTSSNDTINPEPVIITGLPFLDDFSQRWYYPDDSKWEDNFVYINSNFPLDPLSYGVATFDGLDDKGYPYDFNNATSYGIADYLTSRRIDLSSIVDSVFLSFYYQPQGIGNKPQPEDSLRVEFFHPIDSIWKRAWGTKGEAVHPFKLVMIPVDTVYHTSTFQFRFKNYSTLSGNVDHWHVDYVYLNDNRGASDTVFNDVAIVENNYNMLKNYTAMPWSHYKVDSIGNMADTMHVKYKNNGTTTEAVFYKYQVSNENDVQVELYPSTLSSKNVGPKSTLDEPHAVNSMPANDFYFPTNNSTVSFFKIKNYFDLNLTTDFIPKNDTAVTYQVFGSYYAYDDGSAEVGYGVQGVGSKLAHEFTIKKSDTLTALQIYFNPITYNVSAKTFKLTVWSKLNPENIIYQETVTFSPNYTFFNEFETYKLTNPILLNTGKYYFGWEKVSEDLLNVGWDLNKDNSSKVHYNATGAWATSSYQGSLMLRPVFGTTNDPVVSLDDNNTAANVNFMIYPNPSNGFVNIKTNIQNDNILDVYNVFGKHISTKNIFNINNEINLNYLKNGVYLIKITTPDNVIKTHKLIIAK